MRQDQRDALAAKAERGEQPGVLETFRPERASGQESRHRSRAIKREARARGAGPAELPPPDLEAQ